MPADTDRQIAATAFKKLNVLPGHVKGAEVRNWVSTFQDPFGKRLAEFSNQLGTVKSFDQAKDLLDTFTGEWTAYQQAGEEYGKMGGKYAAAVKQNLDPNQDFMKTVTRLQQQIQSTYDTYKAQEDATTKDQTESTPPKTDPVASTEAAKQAAMMARRRALAGSGSAGTILGGAQGTPVLRRPMIMGY